MAQLVACAASFYAHVYFDKEYHVEGSRLQRFAWFRRKQELHFVHHRHANSNFAVIHFFWDSMLGTKAGCCADSGEWNLSDWRSRHETDVGIEVSMTLHESNHGTQNGKNGPVH